MSDYKKLVLSSTVYLIEGNEDIVNNEEFGFLPTNDIFVNNQYMMLLKTAFENIGLFDKERRQKLITIYNKIIGSYNYIGSLKVPIADFTIEPNNIEMLVGETVDVYITCDPKLITDANSIAIYNAYPTLFKISKTDIVNNIMHFTVTGENNGSGNLEISGGKNVKNLDIVVNY
jgi:hypothetical protein